MSLQSLEAMADTWTPKLVAWQSYLKRRHATKLDILGSVFLANASRKDKDTDQKIMRRAMLATAKMLNRPYKTLPDDYEVAGDKYQKTLQRARNEFSAAKAKGEEYRNSIAKRCANLSVTDRMRLRATVEDAMGRGLHVKQATKYVIQVLNTLGV